MRRVRNQFFNRALVFLATTPAVSMAADLVPCSAGDANDTKVCIAAPAGILASSTKASSLVTTLNWFLLAGSIVCCVIFFLKCASRLSDDQYKEAIGPGLGAGLAGLTLYIAYQLVK